MEPVFLYELSLDALTGLLGGWGEPAYRARQVYRQAYVNLAGDYAGMSDLPAALRERLARELPLTDLALVHVQAGDKGMTRKALFRLPGGEPVEAVLMVYADRATVCVSTQSGCAVACSFCATARLGLKANLTPGRMMAQVLWAARELKSIAGDRRLTNIVYMGMGEPFHNYDNWWASVERLHDPAGFNMGARGFTVSTVGVVPGILRLAEAPLPVNLAVSLHAPNDALREQLVPLNRKHPVAEILQAVRAYTDRTHRRVSFEYVLLQGVNDGPELAGELTRLLEREKLVHVNLIPWNPVPDTPLSPSDRQRVLAFQRVLEARKVPCTVRVQRGVDIAAACGQLAGGLG